MTDRVAEIQYPPGARLAFVGFDDLRLGQHVNAMLDGLRVIDGLDCWLDIRKVKTPQEMLALGEDGLKEHIKTIGLFNSKAKNVIALSQILVDEHGGEVPDTREALVKLPGVGRKTANVVLNCWFGQETFAVDTHIFRVGNRTGMAKGKTPDHVEAKLEKRVPQPFRRDSHHWMILHGRYVCKARTPECWRCKVSDLCSFRKKVLEDPRGIGSS